MEQAPQYPKRDFRRMLVVLGAIDDLDQATLVKLAQRTGLDKKTVINLIEQIPLQTNVLIEKNGTVYSIKDWGPVIKRSGARMALTGALSAPTM